MNNKLINLKDSSRINWAASPLNEFDYLGDMNVQLGCLMRIADAVEIMAKNYTQMQNDRDCYMKWYREERERNKKITRSQSALRGYIKRLKKQNLIV